MNAFRKALLVSALAAGALTMGQGASQAAPVGAVFGAASADSHLTQVRGGRSGGGFDILSTVLRALANEGRGGRGGGGRSHGGGRHRR